MNEKLLALYLERLLARLYTEINEADEALGSDVSRMELPTVANSEFTNSLKVALGVKPTEAVESPPGDAIVLSGLRIFAESIREDISALSGSESLRIDPVSISIQLGEVRWRGNEKKTKEVAKGRRMEVG